MVAAVIIKGETMNRSTGLPLKILAAAAALLLPALGFAEGRSYTFLETSYLLTDFDGTPADADVFGVKASLAVNPNWYLFAGFDSTQSDFAGVDLDVEDWSGGVGFVKELGDFADLLMNASFIREKSDMKLFDGEDTLRFSGEDNGYGISLGLRGSAAPGLELEGSADYVNFGGSDSDGISLKLAGRLLVTPMFAIGLNAVVDDSAKSYGAHLRYNFR